MCRGEEVDVGCVPVVKDGGDDFEPGGFEGEVFAAFEGQLELGEFAGFELFEEGDGGGGELVPEGGAGFDDFLAFFFGDPVGDDFLPESECLGPNLAVLRMSPFSWTVMRW